jgi:C4-dicarboxylate transporter DctM subunit
MEILLLFLIMVVLMVVGVPVFLSIGVTTLVAFFAWGNGDIVFIVTPLKMFEGLKADTLLAIPFFILAGNLMNSGGITRRIFRFANALVGRFTGGLGQVNIVASMIFSGMSGSAVADAVGLGQMEIKAMEEAGYDRPFAASVTAASSTIGPVIPPSIPFVIYASITGVETVHLFLAGFAPGILMGLAMMVAVYIISKIRRYPKGPKLTVREFFSSAAHAFFPAMAPAILIGGILLGLFTPTEASIVASVYALILGFVYRELKVKDLPHILWDTVKHSASLMFIMAAAFFFQYFLSFNNVPDKLVTGLTALGANPQLLIAMIMLIVIILGFFIEGNAIFVLTLPLFFPIITKFGIDPIQFGVIMTLGIMLGNLTPPVGMCLFAVARVSKVTMGQLTRQVWPFLLGILVVWILIAYIPEISTFLPNLTMAH